MRVSVIISAFVLLLALASTASGAVYAGLMPGTQVLLADGTSADIATIAPGTALLTRDADAPAGNEVPRQLAALLEAKRQMHGVFELTRVEADGSRGKAVSMVMDADQAVWSTETGSWLVLGYAQVGEQFVARTGHWELTAREIKREPISVQQPKLIEGNGLFVVPDGFDASAALWVQDASEE